MKKSLLSIAVILFIAVPALAVDFLNFPNFPSRAGGISPFDKKYWWDTDSLTFYAPFDDPSNPLRLIKGTGTLSFTRATTATYVHPTTGLVTAAASGQLRIESNGALIEGARTNIILYSEQFNNGAWEDVGSPSVSADNSVSPDGNMTTDNIIVAAVNRGKKQTSAISATSKTWTASAWLSSDTACTATITIDSAGVRRIVDSQKTLSTTPTRYAVTVTAEATDNGAVGMWVWRNENTSDTCTSISAWGEQPEEGAFVSSYATTTSAAATRNKDVLTIPAAGNFSRLAGTFVATVTFGVNGTAYIFDSSTPSADEADGNWIIFNGGAVTFSGQRLGVSSFSISLLATASSTHKIAATWSADRAQLAVDGVLGTEDTSVTVGSADPTTITLGLSQGGAYNPLFGNMKDTLVLNRPFSDVELQSITQ